ncbi:MAG: hypothetical protein IPO07_25110 [Haliscomenobacter sp.]|nr:hypothetical protein [Haliscomenobacter sp.]MBK9491710.1 hypothetical protein [Haliscomenobacter sp.]
MSETHAAKGHQLGFSTITLITVSLIIGLGIFKTQYYCANAGTESIFFAAWIIGGITACAERLPMPKLEHATPDGWFLPNLVTACHR